MERAYILIGVLVILLGGILATAQLANAQSISEPITFSSTKYFIELSEPIETEFTVEKKDPLALRCKYCNKTMTKILENIV